MTKRALALGMGLGLGLLITLSPVSAATLSVTNAAAMEGSWGLEISFADGTTQRAYVEDQSPADEVVYRAQFLFDPNNTALAAVQGERHVIASSRGINAGTATAGPIWELILLYINGQQWVKGTQFFNNGTAKGTSGRRLVTAGGDHQIVVEWTAASGAGITDGRLSISVDGGSPMIRDAKNHNLSIHLTRMGAIKGIDTTTTGSSYYDDFQSFRTLAP